MGLLIGRSAAAEFPDETNTGTSGSLTTQTGLVNITSNGTIYENISLTGGITVNASNVTIRNCKVVGTSASGASACIEFVSGTGGLVEDCELDATNGDGAKMDGVRGQNYDVYRTNLYGWVDGVQTDGANIGFYDCYFHDMRTYDPGPDFHIDAVQVFGGDQNITIDHCTIYGSKNAPSPADPEDIASSAYTMAGGTNILLQNCLIAGGLSSVRNDAVGTNCRCLNNRFSTIFHSNVGSIDAVSNPENWTEFSGNVIHETGEPVT